MAAQTEYRDNLEVALPGLIYDMGNTNIDSFAASAAGNIEYGRFVARAAASDDQVELPGAAAANAIGVSVRATKENEYADGVFMHYVPTETVGVMRSGFIWAEFDAAGGTTDADVTINADGTVSATGAGTALGNLTARIDKPAVAVTIAGAQYFVGLINIAG